MSQVWWGGRAEPQQAAVGTAHAGLKRVKSAQLSGAPEKKRLSGVFVSFGKLSWASQLRLGM